MIGEEGRAALTSGGPWRSRGAGREGRGGETGLGREQAGLGSAGVAERKRESEICRVCGKPIELVLQIIHFLK